MLARHAWRLRESRAQQCVCTTRTAARRGRAARTCGDFAAMRSTLSECRLVQLDGADGRAGLRKRVLLARSLAPSHLLPPARCRRVDVGSAAGLMQRARTAAAVVAGCLRGRSKSPACVPAYRRRRSTCCRAADSSSSWRARTSLPRSASTPASPSRPRRRASSRCSTSPGSCAPSHPCALVPSHLTSHRWPPARSGDLHLHHLPKHGSTGSTRPQRPPDRVPRLPPLPAQFRRVCIGPQAVQAGGLSLRQRRVC